MSFEGELEKIGTFNIIGREYKQGHLESLGNRIWG